MKIGKKTISVCLASLFLFSCSAGGKVSTESPSEEISSEFDDERWDSGLRTLMRKYCGGVLPYPEGMIGGKIHFEEEMEDDGERKLLKIYDESSKFSLGKYYETLEECGWKEAVGYNEDIKRTVDDFPYYELNRMMGDKGYNISYTYLDSDGDGSSGNVIYCRGDFTDKKTSKTGWSARETENIELGLNISLPFMAFGDGYKVEHPSEDTVLISDRSVTDLCEKYGRLLEDDGFVLSPVLSPLYDFYIYTKYLDDKSIYAGLSFQNGNQFKFDFAAIPEKTSDWPSNALSEIESKSGVTIPQFELSEDVPYYYNYTKNEKVYVYAETSTDIERQTDYFSQLEQAGFVNDGSGNFTNAEKGVKLDTKVLMNESLGQWEQYGFQIIVYLA